MNGLNFTITAARRRARRRLLALGIACLPSEDPPRRSSLLGLLAYNGGVFILVLWLGLATPFHGLLLWPTAGLHGILTALLAKLLMSNPVVTRL